MATKLTDAEIYARATKFSEEWKHAKGESQETQAFWIDLFGIFDIRQRRVTTYFERKVGRGHADLFWKSKLLVEQKSLGKNLSDAREQAFKYCDNIDDDDMPQYIITCDFQHFELYNLDNNQTHKFTLKELPENIRLFNFMLGDIIIHEPENPVNHKATVLMASLSKALDESGYKKSDLGDLLTRLAYCMFADDTEIFENHAFHNYLLYKTNKDGSDLGIKIKRIFEILNTPEADRQSHLDSDLRQFSYINGDLFKGEIQTPECTEEMRQMLLEASHFDWSKVSPAIFGNLFQGVLSPAARRGEGAHYTTEENIMRVIGPLFRDGLTAELRKIKTKNGPRRRILLKEFQDRLSKMKFFDPACGSGNFLIIAYREIRRLELSVIQELHDPHKKLLDISKLSRINVDQFYGLELDPFSAKIAEAALWMMDHLMNRELGSKYGMSYARIPLKKHPKILCKDAIEYDWNKLLPSSKCTYVFGNPPYGGSKTRGKKQSKQIEQLVGRGSKDLDYVTAWFIKASRYITKKIDVGFVATNSITQGSQVGLLWNILNTEKVEISFAHRSFKWGSDAPGMAHVYVVIMGLSKKSSRKKRLMETVADITIQEQHKFISPYLIGTETKLPMAKASSKNLNDLPTMAFGTQPIDGGNLIFDDLEKEAFVFEEPESEALFRRFINGHEMINGNPRWILDLYDLTKEQKHLKSVSNVLINVRQWRLKSKRKKTRKLASTPYRFGHRPPSPSKRYLAIPRVSASSREYVPMRFYNNDEITSDATMVINDATVELFGLLTSKMHMVWLRLVGGRLKGDFRYSESVVYNTFPVPDDISSLREYAQKILDVREKYNDHTLGELYDPLHMPVDLRAAHRKLDAAVDKLYRSKKFSTVHERMEYLLREYQNLLTKNQLTLSGS